MTKLTAPWSCFCVGAEALDECGLRYLLAMRLHTCLLTSLPPLYRMQLLHQGKTHCNNTTILSFCGYEMLISSAFIHENELWSMRFLSLFLSFSTSMTGLSTCHFAWAFHSEAEEELLNMIPAMQRGDPQWSELRAVGVGWWIRNINTLRKMVEKVPGQNSD